jgi:rubredoxin
MIDAGPNGSREAAAGDVELYEAGEGAKGEFRCSGCGYGVAIATTLPSCPMCGGGTWERGPWTPFARAEAGRQRR